MSTLEIRTTAPRETECLGEWLADNLPDGTVLALRGDLATGKTCCVRGMARRFGATGVVHSPTFTLVNEYGEERRLYHLDLYRLSGPDEMGELGYEEIFEPDGLCVVEWAERAGGLLPDQRVEIALSHGGGDTRHIRVTDHGRMPEGWQVALQAFLSASTAS
jgi:tRNA threonylcarbamoyladenosine biosynthesis protein TsaE